MLMATKEDELLIKTTSVLELLSECQCSVKTLYHNVHELYTCPRCRLLADIKNHLERKYSDHT